MGSSGGNAYDAAYNARLADLAEEQQKWMGEDRQWSIDYERPYQEAVINANMAMLPKTTEIQGLRLDHAASALPDIYGSLGKHDVGEAMNTATADVASAFGAMGKERDMRMKGLGVMPTSSSFANTELDAKKALGVASARNNARTNTTALNLNEKIQGLSL